MLMFVLLIALLLNERGRVGSAPIISANHADDLSFKFDKQVQQPVTCRALHQVKSQAFTSDDSTVLHRHVQHQLILLHSKTFIKKLSL